MDGSYSNVNITNVTILIDGKIGRYELKEALACPQSL
jgi:hypothetical protein